MKKMDLRKQQRRELLFNEVDGVFGSILLSSVTFLSRFRNSPCTFYDIRECQKCKYKAASFFCAYMAASL